MQRTDAIQLVKETFKQTYDETRYFRFVRELTNGNITPPSSSQMAVPEAFTDHVQSCKRLGTYQSDLGELIDILVVRVKSSFKLERTRTALRNFVAHKLKRGDGDANNYKEAGLVAFVSTDTSEWRFSFVRMEYQTTRDPVTGKYKAEEQLTPARRYSYLVGPQEQTHTAQSRFVDLLIASGHPSVDTVMSAFSVDKVTNEFFAEYKKLFIDLASHLRQLIDADAVLAADFAGKGINHNDFAKKLLGQIVFLYFLQKKGWLGVARGAAWGSGPNNFMRQLIDLAQQRNQSLFNDILEPLFYDTLNVDRAMDLDWSAPLQCRIPFLNGGLFEPLNGYDWQQTTISLPNQLFANDAHTGIFDVFDRYNFTVNEAEPLETEVAIDPEMLGKVFENLLDVDDRAAHGAFYTPREIVHYMCQVSLAHYLTRAMHALPEPIAAADIDYLIYHGDQTTEYEMARAQGTSYVPRIPEAIRRNAKQLDQALERMTVLDPAIGSGAFPVGMMNEIVRLRQLLGVYFHEHRGRTVYELKRHTIQQSLYGVDLAAGAVEIAKLRLWLSLVVDEDDVSRIKPLPNLDFKIVVGNSLLGVQKNVLNHYLFDDLQAAKKQYFDETNHAQKDLLKGKITDIIAQLTNNSHQFDYDIFFHEVINDKKGFDIVIGNPPYVVSNDKTLRKIYHESVFGRPNLYGYFIHLSIEKLINNQGIVVFINPKTLLTDAYFKSLRRFIVNHGSIHMVLNFINRHQIFENVLQSTIVNAFTRDKNPLFVKVKNIRSKAEISHNNDVLVPYDKFKYGSKENMIFLVADSLQTYDIFHKLLRLKTMENAGLTFTTGKIQWDLYKQFLSSVALEGATRLIWAENIQRYFVADLRSRRDKQFINTTLQKVEPIQFNTVVVQRTTSVEQEYRIISMIISPQEFGFPIQVENNTSYLETNIHGLNLKYLLGILNSNLMDFVFRHINSNTHVSSGELNDLPIPRSNQHLEDMLIAVVDQLLISAAQSMNITELEAELNKIVYQLYELSDEEVECIIMTRSAITY